MSSKKKLQIKFRQRLKRRQRRQKLLEKGLNPNDYFYGRYYVGSSSRSSLAN